MMKAHPNKRFSPGIAIRPLEQTTGGCVYNARGFEFYKVKRASKFAYMAKRARSCRALQTPPVV